MNGSQDDKNPTRQSLLSRLRDWNDSKSWQEFFDAYWKLIYSTATKYGLTDVEAQEVVQETFINLSHKMVDFHYDRQKGSFKSWLLQQTRWRILDQLRKRSGEITMPRSARPSPDGDRRTTTIEQIPDTSEPAFSSLWEAEWIENIQDVAMERVKSKADLKTFQIFDLYVLKEWSPTKVCKFMDIPIHQVYLAKHRINKMIRREVSRLEAKTPE